MADLEVFANVWLVGIRAENAQSPCAGFQRVEY